jgi:hypothetical protein
MGVSIDDLSVLYDPHDSSVAMPEPDRVGIAPTPQPSNTNAAQRARVLKTLP